MGKAQTEAAAGSRDPHDMADSGEAIGVFLARNSVEPIGTPVPFGQIPIEERAEGDAIGVAPPTLLELARAQAFDPSIFEEHPPYFWRAHVSNNQLDAYFTRMHATSLQNYAADAADGVSFQNSHITRQLGVGRSVTGRYSRGGGVNPARTEADFYTIPGLRLNSEMGTDDFIMGVRSGLIHDVSIGFYGGEYRCSICDRDMLRDWDCWHIPGFRYDAEGKKADVKDAEARVATAWIHNAHLSEVSCVYDGATPGAAILKAQRESAAGRMPAAMMRLVEMRYRVRLDDRSAGVFAMASQPTRAETDKGGDETAVETGDAAETAGDAETGASTETETGAAQADAQTADQAAADQTDEETAEDEQDIGDAVDVDISRGSLGFQTTREESNVKTVTPAKAAESTPASDAADRSIPIADALLVSDVRGILKAVERDGAEDVLEAVRELVAEVVRLRPEAEDGRAYREQLIKEAIEAGVRAHGNEFATETYQGVLEKSSIPTIIRFRDDWDKTAVGKGMTGGRKSREGGEEGTAGAGGPKNNGATVIPVPDAAFRV